MKKTFYTLVLAFVMLVVLGGTTKVSADCTTSIPKDKESEALYLKPSDADFKSAESGNCHCGKTEYISDSISKKYEVDIWQYKAPVSGWYNIEISSASEVDTKIAVYQKNKRSIFYSATYDELANNYWDREYDYNDWNSHCVVYLKKDQLYFVAVRGYGAFTGKYNLRIEGNRDLKKNKGQGCLWTLENTKNNLSMDYIKHNGGLRMEQVTARQEFTKPEVIILYYWIMAELGVPVELSDGTEFNYNLINKYLNSNPSQAITYCNYILKAFGKIDPTITTKALRLLINFFSSRNNVGTIEELNNKVKDVCRIKITPDKSCPENMKITVLNELEITEITNENCYETFNGIERYYTRTYTFHGGTSTAFSGVEYCKGNWK